MNYLKADLYRIVKERKLLISLAILIFLAFLSALLYSGSSEKEESIALIQLLTQFLPLFFLAPTMLFFGDDFHHRTINNIIVKRQERTSIYLYKILANLLTGLIYVFLAYGLACIMRMILGGQVDWSWVGSVFIHQLPLYSCILLMASTLFIYLPKINQAYLTYILLALLFDSLVRLTLEDVLHLSVPKFLFLFMNLQSVQTTWNGASLVACLFILIYFFLSYSLFQKKELK